MLERRRSSLVPSMASSRLLPCQRARTPQRTIARKPSSRYTRLMAVDKGQQFPTIWERIRFSLVVYLLFFGLYIIANRLIAVEACMDFTTAVDHLVPFSPPMVYPFYLAYLLILTPAAVVTTKRLLYHATLGFSVLVITSCILFFLVPVHVPRPTFIPQTLSEQMVAKIYATDRPVCGFPSLHVSTAILAALVLWRQRKLYGLLFMVPALLTSASTLFVKQHVVFDVAGGVLLASTVDRTIVSGFASGVLKKKLQGLQLED